MQSSTGTFSSSGMRRCTSAGNSNAFQQLRVPAGLHCSREAFRPIRVGKCVLPRPASCSTVCQAHHPTAGSSQSQHIDQAQQASAFVNLKQASSTAALNAGSQQPSAPYASLTRVFLVGQPSSLVRNLAGRKFRAAGPVGLLLFLAGLILAILTAVRTLLVRRVKSCTCCRGYGIVRCRLCNGEGSVEWRGKNTHQETCPLCMTKRYVTCPECGGHYHRKLFIHITPETRGPVADFLGAS